MASCGFEPYASEWWHFSDLVSYPVGTAVEPSKE
jgi:D-alanyl-D-alanine dipeptidase